MTDKLLNENIKNLLVSRKFLEDTVERERRDATIARRKVVSRNLELLQENTELKKLLYEIKVNLQKCLDDSYEVSEGDYKNLECHIEEYIGTAIEKINEVT